MITQQVLDWYLRRDQEITTVAGWQYLANDALILQITTSCLEMDLLVCPGHDWLLMELLLRGYRLYVSAEHPNADLVALDRRWTEVGRIHEFPIALAEVICVTS